MDIALTACDGGFKCHNTPQSSTSSIEFKQTTADLGELKYGDKAGARFRFTNTGQSEVRIVNVKTECSCTTATFSKEPIRPGRDGIIEIALSTEGLHGYQYKTATIETNCPNNRYIKLAITATVEY